MPAVAFIKTGNTSNCDAVWIENGDVISEYYTPWSPNLSQLMMLSRNDLIDLIPTVLTEKVKKDTNKETISNLLIENWAMVIYEKSVSEMKSQMGGLGGGGGSGSANHQGGAGDGQGGAGGNGGNEPEPSPPNPADFGDGSFFLTVQKCFNVPSFKNFMVMGDFTIKTVKVLCLHQWGVKMSDQRILFENRDVFDNCTLNDLSIGSSSILQLTLQGGLSGGIGGYNTVRKVHLKKEDAVASLKENTKKLFEASPEMLIPDGELPDVFIEFLKGEKTKTDNLLSLRQRLGEDFIKTALRQIDGETLLTIKNVMASNRQKKGEKNLTSAEKVEKVLQLLYPQLALLNRCSTRLCHFQGEVMKDLSQMFCEEFNSYNEQQGSASIDISAFSQQVQNELVRRDGRVASIADDAFQSNCSIA